MARRDDAVVIEVALNGVHTKARAALVPTTPDEIAADMIRCLDAGASICHAHDDVGRDGTAADLERVCRTTYQRVLAVHPDALLYPATTWGGPLQERGATIGAARDGLIRTGFVDTDSRTRHLDEKRAAPSDSSIAQIRHIRVVRGVRPAAPRAEHFDFERLPAAALAYSRRTAARRRVRALLLRRGRVLTAGWAFVRHAAAARCLYHLAMLEGSAMPWFSRCWGRGVGSGMARPRSSAADK